MRGRRDFSELFFLAGILLVAINLRAALSSIGPLVDFIRDDLGLSSAAFGLVTTLPLLAFGFVSVLTPVFTRTFGIGRTVLGAMALLTIGIGLRSVFGVFGLYPGTLLLGIAIALGNVSIPILTKQHFSDRAGMITGIYSCLMSLGAAVAAGVSVPLAVNFGFGWRGSLAVWALPSLFAFIFWLPRGGNFEKQKRNRSFFEGLRRLSRIGLVWQIAGFMGLQSMAFYVVLAWLPAILMEAGHDPNFSGWMLSISQAVGVAGAIVVPIWAGRSRDQRLVIAVLVGMELVSIVGLFFSGAGLVLISVSLIGFVHGGTFGLALLLIVLRSSTAEIANELSGIVQSIGYLLAGFGPLIVGVIYDWTLNWNYGLVFLLLAALAKLKIGLEAGRRRTV